MFLRPMLDLVFILNSVIVWVPETNDYRHLNANRHQTVDLKGYRSSVHIFLSDSCDNPKTWPVLRGLKPFLRHVRCL